MAGITFPRLAAFLTLFLFTYHVGYPQDEIDSLITAFDQQADEALKAATALAIGRELMRTDSAGAVKYFRACVEIAANENGLEALWRECNSLWGRFYVLKGEFSTGETFFRKNLELARSGRFPDRVSADAFTDMGALSVYQQAFDSAIVFLNKGIDLLEKSNAKPNEFLSPINNLFLIYHDQSKVEKALETALKGLEWAETAEDARFAAIFTLNTGMSYSMQRQRNEAIHSYKQAISLAREANLPQVEGTALSNLSGEYENLGLWDSVKVCALEAIPLLEAHGDIRLQTGNYVQLAQVARQAGNTALVKEYLAIIQELLTKMPSIQAETAYWQMIGELHQQEGKWQAAEAAFRKGIELTDKIENLERKANLTEALMRLFVAKHQEDSANVYFDRYAALKDRIISKDKAEALARMETEFEIAKKESQIAKQELEIAQVHADSLQRTYERNRLLVGVIILFLIAVGVGYSFWRSKKFNTLLSAKNHELTEANEQKEALLKEIHHRVKNNLQTISSLLKLQARSTDDPIALTPLLEGQNRVESMALVHQKLYQTEDLREVHFQEYLEQLMDALSESYDGKSQQVETVVNAHDISMDIDNAIPLGLIVNELVTNAYKYAFQGKEKGSIRISLHKEKEAGYRLAVSDDGLGLPAGFSMESPHSLGMRLVKMFTRQLRGNLNWHSDSGAHFSIQFQGIQS